MSRKASKIVIAMAIHQQEMMRHCTEFLHIIEKYPGNLVSWSNKNPEYYKGLAEGSNDMFEAILRDQKCYGGFCYLRADCETSINGLDDPEYVEWRRRYYI